MREESGGVRRFTLLEFYEMLRKRWVNGCHPLCESTFAGESLENLVTQDDSYEAIDEKPYISKLF